MKLYGDQPILTREEDVLGRYNFSKNLAEAILSWESKESFCLALYGTWGTGKTSIINMTIEHIKSMQAGSENQEKIPIIIRFEPWTFSTHEDLIKKFLRQLKVTLRTSSVSEDAGEIANQLEIYAKILSVAEWIPTVGGYAEKTKIFIRGLQGVAESIEKTNKEDLDALKVNIFNALEKLPRHILIIIDDVDRLTSSEIKQLFKLIKSVANFPNTIYLLSFDYEIVKKSLEDIRMDNRSDYIDKIIQMGFFVPLPRNSDITIYLLHNLNKIIGKEMKDGAERNRWKEFQGIIKDGLFLNIREMKRYLNLIEFKFPLLKRDVSIVDICILESIQICSKELYGYLSANRYRFVSNLSRYSNDENKELLKIIDEKISVNRYGQVKKLLRLCFPKIDSLYNQQQYTREANDEWDSTHRVCMESYLDFYFQTFEIDFDISEYELDKLEESLSNYIDFFNEIKKYENPEKVKRIFARLFYRIEEKHKQVIQSYMSSIIYILDEDVFF